MIRSKMAKNKVCKFSLYPFLVLFSSLPSQRYPLFCSLCVLSKCRAPFPWGYVCRKTTHSQVFYPCALFPQSGGELRPIHTLPLTGPECLAGTGLCCTNGLQPAGGCCQPERCLSGANSLQVQGSGASGAVRC